MNIDKLLAKVGLKYEDLNIDEKETLNTWMDALQKSAVNVSTIKEYVAKMKDAVEKELSVADLGSKQDTLLKARLRNYLLLEAFMTSPEKAKEALERAISGMVPGKR